MVKRKEKEIEEEKDIFMFLNFQSLLFFFWRESHYLALAVL